MLGVRRRFDHMTTRTVLTWFAAIPLVAVLVSGLVWIAFYFAVYLGLGNLTVRGDQEFAAKSVSQIKPASEMMQLYPDCRHFVTYGPSDTPLFNSVAYFGGRYVLTMQVPISIQSSTSGSMSGTPLFVLNEVSVVSVPPEQVGARFSRSFTFDAEQWQKVYAAHGDFRSVGFDVDTTAVPNFQKYSDACRPSN